MNSRVEWDVPGTFLYGQLPQQPYTSFSTLQKTITTVVLLLVSYYVLSFFDAWPDTFKRSLYDIAVYCIPSHAIYAVQAIMHQYSGAFDDASRLKRADFGKQRAKAEAIRRILGHSPFPSALRKARSLSGLENILPVSKEIGPPGLGNWDNSCYQNSILQGLASLPAFRSYIGKSLELCDETVVSAATHAALRQFLDQLGDASERKTTLWTPAVLKSMDSWQQQDAQEYFTRVIEAVEKEDIKCFRVLKKRSSPGLGALVSNGSFSDESVSRLEKVCLSDDQTDVCVEPDTLTTESRKQVDSFPRSPMDGMLAQALECQTCGFSEGYSLTQFNCLTVNLGLRGHTYLEDLLDEYTDAEMIDGVECTACTKALADSKGGDVDCMEDDTPSPSKRPKLKPVQRTKAKQMTIGRLPQNLVIHINRSIFDIYGDQRKNNSLIYFPTRLDFLSRWCAPLGADEESVQMSYELKCSVTHYGRHENGHYVALGKREKDWYCFNDEIVTKMGEEEVLSRGNVFMLFYEAVDTPSLPDSEKGSPAVAATAAVTDAVQTPVDSSPSSSESEALPTEESVAPIAPIPVMRTASGTLLSTETAGVDTRAQAALSVS